MTETAVTGKPVAEYDRYVEMLAHAMANGLALAAEREFLASLDPSKPLHEAMLPHARSAIQWRFAFNIDEIEAARTEAAEAKIAAVLEQHPNISGECHTCSNEWGPLSWPCPTVRALQESVEE